MNEAELLFTQILDCDRLSLYLNQDMSLDEDKISLISTVLKRRILGEPLQYILGKMEFMELEFKVNKDVFIPRPETEILVETAIKIGRRLRVIGDRLKALDICTGCGNIAISIAKILSYCEIDALDISYAALKIACENAKLNKVNINFIQSDLFNIYNLQPKTYNLIVSNPPYIPTAEIDNLQLEVRYEPRVALDGGKKGLDFYQKIVEQSPRYLKEDGILLMEMGFGQKNAIEKILQDSGNFQIIEIVKDYNHIDRVIVAKREVRENG